MEQKQFDLQEAKLARRQSRRQGLFAPDLLRVPLAWMVLGGIEMPDVRAPIIGAIARDPIGLQQHCQLQKRLVCTPATDIRPHCARLVIDGIPQPALRGLLLHVGPHLTDFRFLSSTLAIHAA